MANEEHLKILKQGVEVWNRWIEDNPEITPNFKDAVLIGYDFTDANFTGADFSKAYLVNVNFSDSKLICAFFPFADLSKVILNGANLQDASLIAASLIGTDLNQANLASADLTRTIFDNTNIIGTNFYKAQMGLTRLGNIDLSDAQELESVIHHSPSTIGIDTLYKSAGQIPEIFLRGCGVPDDFIAFIPDIIGAQQAIQFYSCFISYSTKDEEFAQRLYSRMRDAKLRVWFAPEDVKGGQKLHEQIERAIQLHDRLLIILSEESMQSEWVMSEIRNARKTEIEQNRRKLFPIRLVDFETIKKWKCFDGDNGKDLAVELREYYIPDFSNWKNHDAFEEEFGKLLRDLRAEETKQAEKIISRKGAKDAKRN